MNDNERETEATDGGERLRVATNGDMRLEGVGVTSDSNGPFRLVMRIPGIENLVKLDTTEWTIEWSDALATRPVPVQEEDEEDRYVSRFRDNPNSVGGFVR